VNARAAGDSVPVKRQFLPGKAGVLGDKDGAIDRRMEHVVLIRTCGDDRDLPAVSGRQSGEHLGPLASVGLAKERRPCGPRKMRALGIGSGGKNARSIPRLAELEAPVRTKRRPCVR
jgi:hypothetical protein